MRIAILFFVLGLVAVAAQEPPVPTSSPSPSLARPRRVLLRFALPPLEGTISLGIYNGAGQLVRVLHREDTVSDFTPGHDALETAWDGNDDGGDSLPNGKYSARGYVVGDLKAEGVDYFFNDWVTDERSLHVRHLWQLGMENNELRINADLAGGKKTTFICDQATGAIAREIPPQFGIHCDQIPTLPNLISPIDCAVGRNETSWFVDSLGGSGPRQIKQLSKDHELLRRLEYAAGDPQPECIEASTTEEKIFVVEQNDLVQRFRGLGLVRTTTDSTEGAVSDWKSFFDKKIIAHQTFFLENGKPVPVATTPQAQPEKITQMLRPDPLQHDRPGKLELAIGIDADGSFLKTADGLPLRTISDTPNLTRTVLARPNENTIDVFQDDGAVVEQFRISNLAQMIAFDCGDFELK